MKLRVVFFLPSLLSAAAGAATSPSFDCGKASSKAEHLICGDEALAAADAALASAYSRALAASGDKTALKGDQNAWRKTIRDACTKQQCMLDAYRRRTGELTAASSGTTIILKASEAGQLPKEVTKVLPASLSGIVQFNHDAAGGKYELSANGREYTLSYVGTLDKTTVQTLGQLEERRARVTAKGMLRRWVDGSADFDDRSPITITAQ